MPINHDSGNAQLPFAAVDGGKAQLRILACAYACSPGAGADRFGGGEEILGWNLVRQLDRFHNGWILTHPRNRSGIEAALQHEPLPNLRFHYVDLPGWLLPLQRVQGGVQLYAYLWQIRVYFTARKLNKQFHFQVFQHITYANDWMASFIGALLPVPYIRGPGGGAHRTPKGFIRQYSPLGRLWEYFRIAGQWMFRHDPFFMIGQSRARALLLCNREALNAVPSRWQSKTHAFPVNGVSDRDLQLTSPKNEQKERNQKFRVLSAGKLIQIKGLTLGLEAFKSFAEKYPETEYTIVGDGPQRTYLDKLVHELGIEKQVRLETWMDREELLREMASCDVFLFPSLRDGGGAVVVEAMSAGKPVACLDIGGPGTHITDECGIRITPHSPQSVVRELAEALERLYLDEELRLILGKAARERAEGEYHWDRLGERLTEIYRHAIDRKSN